MRKIGAWKSSTERLLSQRMNQLPPNLFPARNSGAMYAQESQSRLSFAWLLLALLSSLLLLPSKVGAQAVEGGLTLELVERVEQLEREVRHLRGELELYRHQVEGRQRSQNAAPTTPAPPVDVVDTAPSAAEPAPAVENAATTPEPPAATTTDRAAFDKATNALRNGDYAQAITGLQDFLSAHPDSALAGDAQYWLGEAYYANQNYQAAKEAFINLGLNHPQNTYLADALLKLGDSYGQLGELARAKEVLQKLIASYPDTPAAKQAAQRLAVLP